ncbi:helix-turn-helix domain-containing protein [Streptomyces sp. DT24]|uniref:helix-turn-helix domain-containing protein n=1 Tax=unclassified Streptomyces TaxID=2593676 RepID=UPI0023B93534|nr:helix-turn-helix transcriptional regulator [Streptomyces sp. AM 4-1-1]WEH37117.1 helix-turn-helix transcriptional regulator [Streptomyces sp. AM 4-1-1]
MEDLSSPSVPRSAGPNPPPAGAPDDTLGRLLRTGPFSEALRAAIEARGLSLSRIEDRLRRSGTPVSSATLSFWQSGKYRPERAHSLAALDTLETVLGLPSGALSSLLGPPRPRGRWLSGVASRPAMSDVWSGQLDEVLGAVDTRWSTKLTCVSRHQRLDLDAEGCERLLWIRQVLRAECNGPDRSIVAQLADEACAVPVLEPVRPCRVGTTVAEPHNGLFIAELLFDRPLARGETVIVEYTLAYPPPRPSAGFTIVNMQVPTRDCVVEVRFDPAALPVACHTFRAVGFDSYERLLHLDSTGSVHAVAQDLGPCQFGIRWDWD